METTGNAIYAAMQEGKPYKSYIKTILGKVYVTLWDSFTNTPTGSILEGDPHILDRRSIVSVWDTREEAFFRNMNRVHFEQGTLIEYVPPVAAKEKTIEESTDEELLEIVNSKFLALQNKLNSINTIAVLYRMQKLAEEHEKSDKIIRAIVARLSEIQNIKPVIEE